MAYHRKSVKDLRVERLPDLTLYPALRKLWIEGGMYFNNAIRGATLHSLRRQIASCPELESILYCGWLHQWTSPNGKYMPPVSIFTAISDLVRETGRDITVGEFVRSELDLPGSIQRSVSALLKAILLLLRLTGNGRWSA